MAHRPSQRRNLAAPESNPTTPNPDLVRTYESSFLVKHLSSLNLSHSHKHSPLVDAHVQAKAMTTSAIVAPEKESTVPSKRTHKEKPQRPCLELERRKLRDPNDKGVVKDAKVEKPRNPHLEKHGVVERMSVSLAPGGGRRRSFCGSQVDLGDVFAINGAKMVSADMPPFMQIHAVNCARKAIDSMEKFTSKTLALSLKKEFDGMYGPAWHCIVGTSFGSFVTHSVGGFLYFSMDQKLYILLFKTAVQKAG
ncbi:Dynein light chain [Spatholobus suberectus]|nr:Dynein light chain [Spatholobus suberectus]